MIIVITIFTIQLQYNYQIYDLIVLVAHQGYVLVYMNLLLYRLLYTRLFLNYILYTCSKLYGAIIRIFCCLLCRKKYNIDGINGIVWCKFNETIESGDNGH